MLQLQTTTDQFHGLHASLEKTRRTSETVKVSREALTKLLIDHSRLLRACDGQFVNPEA